MWFAWWLWDKELVFKGCEEGRVENWEEKAGWCQKLDATRAIELKINEMCWNVLMLE